MNIMEIDLEKTIKKITDNLDVIYLTDSSTDTYTAYKDNKLFNKIFGESGSYQNMMNIIMTTTISKVVAKSDLYSKFFTESGYIKGLYMTKAKMRTDEKDILINLINLPVDENKSVLILSETDEEDYITDTQKNEKAIAIKSAYLFSMSIDLIADVCQNMSMSEVEDNPANELDISFSQWRAMIINMIHPDDKDTFNEFTDPESLKTTVSYGRSKSIDCQMINLEGVFIWVKLIFNRINTGDDSEYRYVFMVEDIHESYQRLMEDMKKYENMAMRDSLTGLYNHGCIENELASCLEKCCTEKTPVSLIMFDIDHFKMVNDTFGHAAGDYVLKTLAAISRKHLKEHGGILGRWGGEEFLGICENVSEDKLFDIAEKLRVKISEYEFDTVGHITSSFGVIEVRDGETPKAAFERIDNALYHSKSNGRNMVTKG